MSDNTKKRPTKKANGEGTIYFNESRSFWVGQIVLGSKEDGNPNRITRYGKTKKSVREKLKQAELEYYTGCLVDKSKITINMLGEQILQEKLNLNLIIEPTYYRHLGTLKALFPISHIPIQQVNITQLKSFFSNIANKYSQSYIDKQYQMLKRIFKVAKKRHIITEDFFEDKDELPVPRARKKEQKTRALTIEEQKKFCELLESDKTIPYREQFLLSVFTGMRMGEINALQISDVNFTFHTISISRTMSRGKKGEAMLSSQPKTVAGERVLRMSNFVESLLKETIGEREEGFIFLRKGKLISTSQVNSEYIRLTRKHDIIDPMQKGKTTLHSLRHTYATRCIESGMSPKVLQGLLGHTDIKITLNTYCDVFEQFERKHLDEANEYLMNIGIVKREA